MPDRVALLIPGYAYGPERLLLRSAREVFDKHGWTTRDLAWPEPPPPRDGQELPVWFARQAEFVRAYVEEVLDRRPAPRIALAGKSMGAFAAGLAADRALPAIWLTPILRDSPVPSDLRRATEPFLLVGSVADPSWDPVVAREFGQPVYEAGDADHAMEVAGDPVRTAEILHEVTAAMDAFVRRL